jgi:hypothetical protein
MNLHAGFFLFTFGQYLNYGTNRKTKKHVVAIA